MRYTAHLMKICNHYFSLPGSSSVRFPLLRRGAKAEAMGVRGKPGKKLHKRIRREVYFQLFLFSLISFFSAAQDAPPVPDTVAPAPVQISILTCGLGDELYASFGHTGVRVINKIDETDHVYNYGTFNFSDPDFYQKFVSGKLLYYLDKSTYADFIETYVYEKRYVKEQILDLNGKDAGTFVAFLEKNLLPENRSYKYDFLFDNCATRVRDLFPGALGEEFYFGDALDDKLVSYRVVINQYLSHKHWERFGINLLLGSKVDSVMTNEGSMFLPDFLYKGLVHAHYKGAHLVASEHTILDYRTTIGRTLNGPMWAMVGVLIIVILVFHIRSFYYLRSAVRFILLFVTGLLGILMVYMWAGTDHQSCSNNYNILWAIPLNVIVAFFAGKKKTWLKIYALAAISLLIVALFIHVIGIQRLPLIELSPLLISLMYIYVDIYKTTVALAGASAKETIE